MAPGRYARHVTPKDEALEMEETGSSRSGRRAVSEDRLHAMHANARPRAAEATPTWLKVPCRTLLYPLLEGGVTGVIVALALLYAALYLLLDLLHVPRSEHPPKGTSAASIFFVSACGCFYAILSLRFFMLHRLSERAFVAYRLSWWDPGVLPSRPRSPPTRLWTRTLVLLAAVSVWVVAASIPSSAESMLIALMFPRLDETEGKDVVVQVSDEDSNAPPRHAHIPLQGYAPPPLRIAHAPPPSLRPRVAARPPLTTASGSVRGTNATADAMDEDENDDDTLSHVLPPPTPPVYPLPGYCEWADEAFNTAGDDDDSDGEGGGSGKPLWMRWGDSVESAVALLLGNMSSREKASLVSGIGYSNRQLQSGFYIGSVPAVPRLGLPSIKMHDGPHGFRTHHHRVVGQVTSFPCLLGLAATWDPILARELGSAIGTEFRRKGANVLLGPAVHVHRVSRGGRNAESLSGEDPLLGARLGAEFVRGVQAQRVAAVVKHFALNSQETHRQQASSDASERVAFEVYYPPFEAAIGAGAAAVMCAYNKVNGTHACESGALLNNVLKARLGFRGFVLSDWGAVHSADASRQGCDVEMPGADGFFGLGVLRAARVSDSLLTSMVSRLLRPLLTLDALDARGCTVGCDCDVPLYSSVAATERSVAVARAVAAASAVLLKNEGGALPLSRGARVALLGDACGAPHEIDPVRERWTKGDYYVVGGSARVLSDRAVSIRRALEARGVELTISASNNLADALHASHAADVLVACAGATTSESVDRPSLKLDQHDFLTQLAMVKPPKPLVVLVMAPGAVLTDWASGVDAVALMFLAGQETGNAWADVLLGEVSPSGKLPLTLPLSEADVTPPCEGARCVYTEGLHVGWRGLVDKPVAFPFGHGLSYARFEYEWAIPLWVERAPLNGGRRRARVQTADPAVRASARAETAVRSGARQGAGLRRRRLSDDEDEGDEVGGGDDDDWRVRDWEEEGEGEEEGEEAGEGELDARSRTRAHLNGDDDDGEEEEEEELRKESCESVHMVVRVRNSGLHSGAEVVQLYLRFAPRHGEPALLLRGFQKTRLLLPGESADLFLELRARDLSIWNGEWSLVKDEFQIHIGASSRDVRLRANFSCVPEIR